MTSALLHILFLFSSGRLHHPCAAHFISFLSLTKITVLRLVSSRAQYLHNTIEFKFYSFLFHCCFLASFSNSIANKILYAKAGQQRSAKHPNYAVLNVIKWQRQKKKFALDGHHRYPVTTMPSKRQQSCSHPKHHCHQQRMDSSFRHTIFKLCSSVMEFISVE